jgi:hypothetical protein
MKLQVDRVAVKSEASAPCLPDATPEPRHPRSEAGPLTTPGGNASQGPNLDGRHYGTSKTAPDRLATTTPHHANRNQICGTIESELGQAWHARLPVGASPEVHGMARRPRNERLRVVHSLICVLDVPERILAGPQGRAGGCEIEVLASIKRSQHRQRVLQRQLHHRLSARRSKHNRAWFSSIPSESSTTRPRQVGKVTI